MRHLAHHSIRRYVIAREMRVSEKIETAHTFASVPKRFQRHMSELARKNNHLVLATDRRRGTNVSTTRQVIQTIDQLKWDIFWLLSRIYLERAASRPWTVDARRKQCILTSKNC
jgi:hypothetical protein